MRDDFLQGERYRRTPELVRGFVEPLKEGSNPHEGIMRQTAELSGGADLLLTEWREGHWLFARQPLVHFGFSAQGTVDQAAAWLRGLNMTNEEQQALSRIQLPGPLPPERWRGSAIHWERYETAYLLLAGLASKMPLTS